MSDQQSLNSENAKMLDLVDEPSFQQAHQDVSMACHSVNSQGAKKIPPQWSRIVNMENAQEKDLLSQRMRFKSGL